MKWCCLAITGRDGKDDLVDVKDAVRRVVCATTGHHSRQHYEFRHAEALGGTGLPRRRGHAAVKAWSCGRGPRRPGDGARHGARPILATRRALGE